MAESNGVAVRKVGRPRKTEPSAPAVQAAAPSRPVISGDDILSGAIAVDGDESMPETPEQEARLLARRETGKAMSGSHDPNKREDFDGWEVVDQTSCMGVQTFHRTKAVKGGTLHRITAYHKHEMRGRTPVTDALTFVPGA